MHDLRTFIDSKLTIPIANPTVWNHLILLKINCFVWRACMDRIPTTAALSRRGVRTSSLSCSFCINGVDEANHIIADCPFALATLSRIMTWCNVPIQSFSSVTDIVNFAANWGHCPKRKKIMNAIVYGYTWCVWRARNDSVFNKTRTSPGKLADHIITVVFSWLKNRGNFGNCIWANWCSQPFNIL